MPERLSVAGSPLADTQAERQAAAWQGGGAAQALLSPHWGNAAIQRMAPALGLRLAATPRALQRCGAGGCTCGGACGGHEDELEEELRLGSAALQRAVANRRMIARDQDPGPPEPAEMRGLSCGFKSDGTPYCTVSTGKGELEFDWKSLSPQEKQAAFDKDRPKQCPPERWNWFSKLCCAPGERLDMSTRHCASASKEQPLPPIRPFELPSSPPLPPSSPEPFVVPPAPPPPEKGDFPLPDEGQAYA